MRSPGANSSSVKMGQHHTHQLVLISDVLHQRYACPCLLSPCIRSTSFYSATQLTKRGLPGPISKRSRSWTFLPRCREILEWHSLFGQQPAAWSFNGL